MEPQMTVMPTERFDKLCDDVATIREKVACIPDMERRLRNVESTRDKAYGFLAAVGVSGTALGAALAKVIGLH